MPPTLVHVIGCGRFRYPIPHSHLAGSITSEEYATRTSLNCSHLLFVEYLTSLCKSEQEMSQKVKNEFTMVRDQRYKKR
jgi:hypothetical protein